MVLLFLAALTVVAAFNFFLHYHVNPRQNGPYALLFFFSFVACLGHLFLALSTNLDQAIISNKVIYLGSIFLPVLTFNACLSICKIKCPTWSHDFLMLLAFIVLAMSFTVGHNGLYYKSIKYIQTYGVGNFTAEYGIGHDIFNCSMVGFVIINVSLIVYAFIKKKNVSFKSLVALSAIEAVSILSFFISRFVESDTLVMPAVYVFDQFALLYICYRVKRYDVEQIVSQVLETQNVDSYVLIDSDNSFLGSNALGYETFPNLKNCRIDHTTPDNHELNHLLLSWIKEEAEGKVTAEKNFEQDGKYYKIKLRQLPLSGSEKINMFKIEDETSIHNYINMLGTNNVRLELMLKENDSQIRSIQEQMVVGMAHMVEKRDSNTGSHIKRTSRVVQILVDYLRKDHTLGQSEFFYDCLVSAAPMHDIGKIAIDDRILRKPGRFTPQEYEEMKEHPEKGAMIVENLLTVVESPDFVKIAKNVARYHHERYDGFGYPKKLKGTEIPFEARVMAIADVYDALVSKRCYKAEMSFEEAYNIIIDGMGTQFDPSLKDCFIACRKKLEEYYSNLSEDEA
ncbi:N-terminal 7TM region of histidine kinase [Fibrobacter sp. UWB15]|jgi:response regulator RpfG family c-di-GMP phosphodiesterase|uniref:HD domain-containing phosphohydrolase n=1 Tax=unclassified Fibrobacter TaxID=2634177 RepID=UPI000919BF05|nr:MULTISPECIES: HD domain-containing phosphohydrolase [unclassified Fibrobacter]PWJ68024.1 histidine kinase-like protein [Fibrobacter sp. UWB6]SHF84766.1 N-terminal 7TM region of histidine kinase [Fibrobacter sp. UWB8]SMG17407.1 N-terminal 7TM region of histidine kinase [Fibrobacter sp. UWB15]